MALRPAGEVPAAVDDLVARGKCSSRTEVVRSALGALLAAHEEADIDEAPVRACRAHPESQEEIALAAAATRALCEEEPW